MAHSTNQAHSKPSRSPLALWVETHERQLGLSIKGRLRGNSLHLLCEFPYEADSSPSQEVVHRHFQSATNYAAINRLIPPGYPRIRHLWIYGRVNGAKKPSWTVPLHLHPVQQGHLAKPLASLPEASPCEFSSTSQRVVRSVAQPTVTPTAEELYSLAEQGHPKAIAYYLQDVLIDLGIESNIRVKLQRQRPNTTRDRLWVTCQGAYSPAAALVGEPIARQLRALSLHNVEDALLQFRVKGEEAPDWVLRIDLTPQEEILKELARWGDVEAISRLVNQVLHPLNGQLIQATIKDITLHLSCAPITPASLSGTHDPEELSTDQVISAPPSQPSPAELDANDTRGKIAELLNQLAPQGVHNAVLYGQRHGATTPDWVEWVDLPTKEQLDRTVPPLQLAENGDLDAIAFLVQRVLNPSLNDQLATGGVRIQALQKNELLHVMCDAPLCPDKADVIERTGRLLQSLNMSGVKGVRIYGRRAGQRSPRWHHSIAFGQPSTETNPEVVPQFAATDAYVTELVTPPTEPIIRPDLTPSDLWKQWRRLRTRTIQAVRRSLLATQLVIPSSDSPELTIRSAPRNMTFKTALVWGAVGALTLVQADLGLNRLSRLSVARTLRGSDSGVAIVPPLPPSPNVTLQTPDGQNAQIGDPNLPGATPTLASPETSIPGDFGTNPLTSQTIPPSASALSLTTALANSPYPSFNSQQLDFKLALYYQRLIEIGPPDVLILGSSRALRGIDPTTLEQELSELGYENADVFNFGINGATAQVVELIIQRLLMPEQLPKLIIWADGARAFNSGRDDRTYNGILASEGYERLLDGSLVLPSLTAEEQSELLPPIDTIDTADRQQGMGALGRALASSYQALDEQLSDGVARLSASYARRDRIKAVLQYGLTAFLPQSHQLPPLTSNVASGTIPGEMPPPNTVVPDGFETPNALNPNPNELNTLQTGEGVLERPTSLSAIDNIDDDGFLSLRVRFDPTQYYQQYARVSGSYDKDYSNFRLEGTQGDALLTLLSLGQTYEIPIVFINMPLTQEYLDPVRLGHEQTFRQYMLSLALQQEHFIFRDLGELWLDKAEHRSYFSDPSHLNRYGAQEVSLHISKDPMIPWNVTTR